MNIIPFVWILAFRALGRRDPARSRRESLQTYPRKEENMEFSAGAIEWVVTALLWIVAAIWIGVISVAALSNLWRFFFGRKEEDE